MAYYIPITKHGNPIPPVNIGGGKYPAFYSISDDLLACAAIMGGHCNKPIDGKRWIDLRKGPYTFREVAPQGSVIQKSENHYWVRGFSTVRTLDRNAMNTLAGFDFDSCTNTVSELQFPLTYNSFTSIQKEALIQDWYSVRRDAYSPIQNGRETRYPTLWQEIFIGIKSSWARGERSKPWGMAPGRLRSFVHGFFDNNMFDNNTVNDKTPLGSLGLIPALSLIAQTRIDAIDAYFSYLLGLTSIPLGWGGRLGINPFDSLVQLFQSGVIPIWDENNIYIYRGDQLIETFPV